MKPTKYILITASACLLTAYAGLNVRADEAAASNAGKTFTGTVTSVDTNDNLLSVKGWFFITRQFNLGEGCTYRLLDKNSNTPAGLRAGQKIVVTYRDAHGVLIAAKVKQEPMRHEGMVKSIDPATHTLTLHRNGCDYCLQQADDCKIVLRDGKTGSAADIKPGSHVTVTYETPGGREVARKIVQTSVEFSGSLAAIDLGQRTVKVKSLFAAKKFSLADNCTIVVNGNLDSKLSDLKPQDQLEVSYDEIKGINVANRIAVSESQTSSVSHSETTSL